MATRVTGPHAVLRDPAYRRGAQEAAALIGAADGGGTAAELLWSRLIGKTPAPAGNRRAPSCEQGYHSRSWHGQPGPVRRRRDPPDGGCLMLPGAAR